MVNGWTPTSLGEILRLEKRPVKLEPDKEYAEIGIYSYGRGIFHKNPRTGFEVGNKDLFEIKQGDFIFQITFAWEGAIGLASDAEDGMFGSVRFPTYRVNEDICYPPFLLNYFKTEEGLRELGRISPGSAGRNRVLATKRLPEILVPLPSLTEQQRIISDIEILEKRSNEVQDLREAINVEVKNMLTSTFWKLTSGAPRARMSDVAPLVRRPIIVELDKEYFELGVRSFGNGTFHKPALTGADVGTKKIFHIEPGDLVFSNVFAWEGGIAVAKPVDKGRVGSHRFITCVPKSGAATAKYLCFYFLTQEGLEKIGIASPGGAGRNRTLGLNALANIEVPVPDYDKQLWFDDLLDMVNELRELQSETQEELDALLPSVLDKTFKGEL